MGREVGSTQQRRMTNPTNCGIAHFQALPIPSLTIRPSEVPLKRASQPRDCSHAAFREPIRCCGQQIREMLRALKLLCSEPFASLISPYVMEETDELNGKSLHVYVCIPKNE
jgi:hypothetical protein